jgi:serine/threonine-protein kinase
MTPEELSAKRVGTTIREKWTLERLLGIGGMASVYSARHKIGRRDAIKILHPEIAQSPQLRERFEQEAHAVNAFRHPGVVEIRDVDVTEDGAPFLVMELLDGETLAERIKRGVAVSVDEALRIASETLDVLAAAHARGIIHRDVKPDNLFVTTSGAIKVLDFGIARVKSGRMKTNAGVTLGTMAYMPPEQARGAEIDARADVYAVGATLFRVLAGRIVHASSTDAELVLRATTDHAPALASVAPNVPEAVCAIVDRALAFDRDHRYPDAATMKRDVDLVRSGQPPAWAASAPPLPPRPPPTSFPFGAPPGRPAAAASATTRAGRAPDAPTVVHARPQAAAQGGPLSSAGKGEGPIASPRAPSVDEAPTRAGSSRNAAATVVSASAAMPTGAIPSSRVVMAPSPGPRAEPGAPKDGLARPLGVAAGPLAVPSSLRSPGGTMAIPAGPASMPSPPVRGPAGPASMPSPPVRGPAGPASMPSPPVGGPPSPSAAPVLTPYGELSAYVKKAERSPNNVLFIVAAIAGVVGLALVVGVVLLVRAKSSSDASLPGLTPPAATSPRR